VKQSPESVLAFDFGLRQIGVATGNTLLGTTQALPILPAREGIPVWQQLEQVIREWAPDLVVVGDPINMDGSDSELAQRARKFARRLEGRFGLKVVLVDERLSSFAAKQEQRELGHKGDFKKQPIDSQAAQIILETWLAEQALPT
jgi:putative pre-16S rRNA nuclease